MDLDHIDEAIRNMKPSRLKNGSLDKLYREMRNLCCACTETCHNRNPRASYRHKTSLINAGHERETGSDDSDNDDGSDSDSDWEEQQENLRKKRSGGGGGTKRIIKALSPAVMTIVIQQKTIIFSQMMALPVTRYYYIMCTVRLLHMCLLYNVYSTAITHVQYAYCINTAII